MSSRNTQKHSEASPRGTFYTNHFDIRQSVDGPVGSYKALQQQKAALRKFLRADIAGKLSGEMLGELGIMLRGEPEQNTGLTLDVSESDPYFKELMILRNAYIQGDLADEIRDGIADIISGENIFVHQVRKRRRAR